MFESSYGWMLTRSFGILRHSWRMFHVSCRFMTDYLGSSGITAQILCTNSVYENGIRLSLSFWGILRVTSNGRKRRRGAEKRRMLEISQHSSWDSSCLFDLERGWSMASLPSIRFWKILEYTRLYFSPILRDSASRILKSFLRIIIRDWFGTGG